MLLDIYQATGFLLFSVKNTTIILVQDLFWINFYFYYYYYFLDHCCRKSVDFFTPVIRTITFSYAPYYYKRVLLLVKREFTFEKDSEFVRVNKYSSLLFTTW